MPFRELNRSVPLEHLFHHVEELQKRYVWNDFSLVLRGFGRIKTKEPFRCSSTSFSLFESITV
jgi:hypothetical protein